MMITTAVRPALPPTLDIWHLLDVTSSSYIVDSAYPPECSARLIARIVRTTRHRRTPPPPSATTSPNERGVVQLRPGLGDCSRDPRRCGRRACALSSSLHLHLLRSPPPHPSSAPRLPLRLPPYQEGRLRLRPRDRVARLAKAVPQLLEAKRLIRKSTAALARSTSLPFLLNRCRDWSSSRFAFAFTSSRFDFVFSMTSSSIVYCAHPRLLVSSLPVRTTLRCVAVRTVVPYSGYSAVEGAGAAELHQTSRRRVEREGDGSPCLDPARAGGSGSSGAWPQARARGRRRARGDMRGTPGAKGGAKGKKELTLCGRARGRAGRWVSRTKGSIDASDVRGMRVRSATCLRAASRRRHGRIGTINVFTSTRATTSKRGTHCAFARLRHIILLLGSPLFGLVLVLSRYGRVVPIGARPPHLRTPTPTPIDSPRRRPSLHILASSSSSLRLPRCPSIATSKSAELYPSIPGRYRLRLASISLAPPPSRLRPAPYFQDIAVAVSCLLHKSKGNTFFRQLPLFVKSLRYASGGAWGVFRGVGRGVSSGVVGVVAPLVVFVSGSVLSASDARKTPRRPWLVDSADSGVAPAMVGCFSTSLSLLFPCDHVVPGSSSRCFPLPHCNI
ncbi:hypothetical protein C8R45DRAFT_1102995 [Mycena sanguinolenta]|nr:hypothetical protein C8R45DRAFT_1102995 [Mycena sanguinolenta]